MIRMKWKAALHDHHDNINIAIIVIITTQKRQQ